MYNNASNRSEKGPNGRINTSQKVLAFPVLPLSVGS